jgi:hypothetical protein
MLFIPKTKKIEGEYFPWKFLPFLGNGFEYGVPLQQLDAAAERQLSTEVHFLYRIGYIQALIS